MLLAFWPLLFSRNNAPDGGTHVTHHAIHREGATQRTPAMIAAEAHLQRLQEADHGTGFERGAGGELALASVPGGHQPVGDVAVRIPQHERTLVGRIPEALGASLAANNAVPFALDESMKRYAAKQAADEDDEMAMIIILSGLV